MYRKGAYRLLVVLVLTVLTSSPAWAGLYITEIERLNFALLEIPTGGGKQHITIPPNGGSYRGNGVVLMGTPHRGEYFITSPFRNHRRRTISIDIQNISTGTPAIKLKKFRGIYGGRRINFPAWGLPNPGKEGKVFYLGAKLVYKNTVEERTYHPSFDIVIIYE